MLPWVVKEMPWEADWSVDHDERFVRLEHNARSIHDMAFPNLLERAKERFKVLKGWRDELYPIYGESNDLKDYTMERAGSALFGIVTYGVHMTVFQRSADGMKIWVPQRTKSKQTYPSMLDNSVAGGISAGEKPFESLIREAAEEASLPEDLVRRNAQACGNVAYFHVRDKNAGGETGLLQPEVQYVYDLEVDCSVVPKPADNEVEKFFLYTVEEVQEALIQGLFKPNCALVLVDFFVRHGVITPENQRDYIEIVSRMHRKLPFPTGTFLYR
ncbi:hypothetical protein MMC20_000266 [Loxospora ochrophaea]|nr:hypothetical protein [Loxospora ochrophaea]